jgi:hypothetical protein
MATKCPGPDCLNYTLERYCMLHTYLDTPLVNVLRPRSPRPGENTVTNNIQTIEPVVTTGNGWGPNKPITVRPLTPKPEPQPVPPVLIKQDSVNDKICPICTENLLTDEYQAKWVPTLHKDHPFCESCLSSLDSLTCPFCRQSLGDLLTVGVMSDEVYAKILDKEQTAKDKDDLLKQWKLDMSSYAEQLGLDVNINRLYTIDPPPDYTLEGRKYYIQGYEFTSPPPGWKENYALLTAPDVNYQQILAQMVQTPRVVSPVRRTNPLAPPQVNDGLATPIVPGYVTPPLKSPRRIPPIIQRTRVIQEPDSPDNFNDENGAPSDLQLGELGMTRDEYDQMTKPAGQRALQFQEALPGGTLNNLTTLPFGSPRAIVHTIPQLTPITPAPNTPLTLTRGVGTIRYQNTISPANIPNTQGGQVNTVPGVTPGFNPLVPLPGTQVNVTRQLVPLPTQNPIVVQRVTTATPEVGVAPTVKLTPGITPINPIVHRQITVPTIRPGVVPGRPLPIAVIQPIITPGVGMAGNRLPIVTPTVNPAIQGTPPIRAISPITTTYQPRPVIIPTLQVRPFRQ